MKSTICLLKEWTLKASRLLKADSMFLQIFLVLKGCLCSSKRYSVSFGGRDKACSIMCCLYLCGRVESDSDSKNNNLFLNWHNPVYSSSACGILLRLGD